MRSKYILVVFGVAVLLSCGSKEFKEHNEALFLSDSIATVAETAIRAGDLQAADSLIIRAREIFPRGECKARILRIDMRKLDGEKNSHIGLISLTNIEFGELQNNLLKKKYLENPILDSLFKINMYENKSNRAKLVREYEKQEEVELKQQIALAAKQKAQEEVATAILRKNYAKILREKYLDENLDIKVLVYGNNNTVIKLSFVLFNDVWSHKMQKGNLITEIQNMGFKKLIMTDGYDYNVYWNF